jgi:hypothetical protein
MISSPGGAPVLFSVSTTSPFFILIHLSVAQFLVQKKIKLFPAPVAGMQGMANSKWAIFLTAETAPDYG